MDKALSLIQKYKVDEPHAKKVAELALSIFDQTKKLHHLGNKDRQYLDAAGILHNLGTAISFEKHHKHSFELIMKEGIQGFSKREILIVANIARYHRRAFPSTSHKAYKKLSRSDRDRVKKMSAILRIADALDCSWTQSVDDVQVSFTKAKVKFVISSPHDVSAEIQGCKKKAEMWKNVFHMKAQFSQSLMF